MHLISRARTLRLRSSRTNVPYRMGGGHKSGPGFGLENAGSDSDSSFACSLLLSLEPLSHALSAKRLQKLPLA
jgi:hypothetical protein